MSRGLGDVYKRQIVGILHILNDSLSDVVKSDETRVLYGQDFFYEKLLGLQFKITPFSFFQPNTKGAEVLYETVREYIGDIRDLTVFDLFSGTGTISQVLAPVAKKVIGVEIVEEAVEAAVELEEPPHAVMAAVAPTTAEAFRKSRREIIFIIVFSFIRIIAISQAHLLHTPGFPACIITACEAVCKRTSPQESLSLIHI